MGELHLFKKHTISLLIIFLLASAVLAKPIEAHTVSPVNPNAQQTTKSSDELACAPAEPNGKTESFPERSEVTVMTHFLWLRLIESEAPSGNRLLFTAAIMPEGGLKQLKLKIQ